MKQYIDKSALVAELNILIAELVKEGEDTMFEQGRISAFEDLKVFINHTLEVKEIGIDFADPKGDIGVKEVEEEPVSNDLEEAARRIATRHSHITGDTYYANDAWFFKKGAQWQKEQMAKEVDLKKEFDNYTKDIWPYDVRLEPFTHLYKCAEYFYKLGLKAQKGK